jgi:Sucrase/ferredoxin-like
VTSRISPASTPWPRCADVAEAAGDPLEGSAPPAEQWFLVEHPGPWARYVLADPRFDRRAAGALDRWAHEHTGRVLLVRRPGRAGHDPERRRWFRVDSRAGHESVRTGLFAHERELVGVVADPTAGAPYEGPLYVVCTHGRHDTCCAVRGRPLAAALAADQPNRTWEASHIGGCRFAATMVLLPHGVVLGDVPSADAPDVAARYAAGVLPTQWVRGRASLPPAVQAAQQHARIAGGAYGVDALRPVDVGHGAGTWRVTFADPDATVVLRERRVATGRPLTCAATVPGWIRVFDLIEVTLGMAPVPS